MKHLIPFAICILFIQQIFAQQYQPLSKDHSRSSFKKVDPAMVHQIKQSLLPGSTSQARGGAQSISIDYDLEDELACTSPSVYERFIWEMHSQFPNDSAYNLNYRWTAVSFDTLVDANTGTTFPYTTSQVTIDSIVVLAAHENFTGTQDQIVISILEYVPGAPSVTLLKGLQTSGPQTTITNNVLYADTIRTTSSLTPGLTNLVSLIIRPNLTLATGQKFLVSVHFYGDTLNDFYFLAGYCDKCNENCVAENSIYDDNTISHWIRWQQGMSISGRDNDLYFPCGRTGAPFSAVPGNCESWFVQNTAISAFLTLDGGSGGVCTPPAATGTPGWSPQYNSFPCVEQGVPFDATVNFENFTSVGGFTLNSFRIDSITNLPCNLNWQTNKLDNTFSTGETGCINISGTTNDTVGPYEWQMYITIDVAGVGSFDGEVNVLVDQFAMSGITLPDLAYYLRVIAPGATCPSVTPGTVGNTACGSGGQTGNCDVIANIDGSDTPTNWGNANGGYLAGHNGDGFPAFADFFTNSGTGTVPEVTFWFVGAETLSPSSVITATIWDVSAQPGVFGNPNRPGTVLATQDVLISDIVTDVSNSALTTVTFSTPATVTGNFYAGFQVTYAAGDTVGLVLNQDGQSSPPNLLWIDVSPFVPGQWARVDSLFGISVSGYIFPEVCATSSCPTITVGISKTDATCTASDGSATAVASGGASPYSYAWSVSGQTNASISGLAAGIYAVTATDNDGCTGTASVTIGSTTLALTVTGSSAANTSCTSGNGTATATATNGTQPYTYLWSGNAGGQTTQTITALSGGNYSVTVIDANGCTGTTSIVVGSNPLVLTLSGTGTDNTSCTAGNGTATATVSNGTPPFTYLWSGNAGGQTTQTITGLIGGNYFVTVTDSNGCTGTTSIIVGDNQVTLTVTGSSTTNTSCTPANGTATATVSNGVQPYSYVWSPNAGGQTTQTITALNGGSYSVTVTDSNGCTGTGSINVASTTVTLNITLNVDHVTSCITDNGSVEAVVTGGSGNYSYSWNNGASTQIISSLSTGTFSVTVTDIPSSCTGIAGETVADSSGGLGVTVTATDATSGTASDGTATATAFGGSGSYTYSWDNFMSGSNIVGLSPGTYIVTVIDDITGCSTTESIMVGFPVTVLPVTSNYEFALYPNPTNGKISLKLDLNETENIRTEWYNILGENIFNDVSKEVSQFNKEYDLSSYAEGVYFVRIIFGNRQIIKRVTVSR